MQLITFDLRNLTFHISRTKINQVKMMTFFAQNDLTKEIVNLIIKYKCNREIVLSETLHIVRIHFEEKKIYSCMNN